jgi:electron transfer flavoprotein beta subunit
MKLLVCFKSVPDPAAGPPGAAAGSSAARIVNPFDEIAVEEAVRLRERGAATEIVAVTIGPAEAEAQARSVLAMGCDRAIRVDESRWLDPYAVARILRAVVRCEGPALVLMGKQAIDDDSNQAGQMLAGLLAWPQATFTSKLELSDGGRRARCTRETDSGLEVIVVRLPALVTVDLRLNEPRYVSLPGLMKARSKPIVVMSCKDLGIDAQPATTVISTSVPPARPPGTRVQTVDELLVRLRQEAKVL